ncbi:MAG: fructose-bisphosphate aldolase [Chloroflexi bacterium]|nr:fructose-bisphosphate aldolase [Chloroflexota bacterium]
MTVGKRNRMNRILNPASGKGLIIAVDHGMALGPTTGLVDIARTIRTLSATGKVDAWLITKGILTTCFEPDGRQGIILRASGAATIAGEDLTNEGLTTSVDTALRLGADALATTAFIGSPNEHETLMNMAYLADECHQYDLPLLGVLGVGKTMENRMLDPQYLALGARVAVEHGADMVKTYYTPQDFNRVIAGCPVPVMIAGGPKCDTDLDTLNMINGALKGGARGIVMGRNIWQSARPAELLDIVWRMIHQGLSIEEAGKALKTRTRR